MRGCRTGRVLDVMAGLRDGIGAHWRPRASHTRRRACIAMKQSHHQSNMHSSSSLIHISNVMDDDVHLSVPSFIISIDVMDDVKKSIPSLIISIDVMDDVKKSIPSLIISINVMDGRCEYVRTGGSRQAACNVDLLAGDESSIRGRQRGLVHAGAPAQTQHRAAALNHHHRNHTRS